MDRLKFDDPKKLINKSEKRDYRSNDRTNERFNGQNVYGFQRFHDQKESHKQGRTSEKRDYRSNDRTNERFNGQNSYGFQRFHDQKESHKQGRTSEKRDYRFNDRTNVRFNNQNFNGLQHFHDQKVSHKHGRTSNVPFNNQDNFHGFRSFRHHNERTITSIEVTPPKVVGHFQTDRYGKNVVLDGSGGIRVYSLPVYRKDIVKQCKYSDIEEVVDDCERLLESDTKSAVTISDCYNLNFDLLNGYVPLKYGGNTVSLCGIPCDRTAGMRWMVENHQKLKCNDGSRLFDVDFYAGNGVMHYVMACQFNTKFETDADIAVILFKGTYFLFLIDLCKESTKEVHNKLSFGGIRFEDYVSREVNKENAGPSPGVHNNYADFVKYNNVVRFDFHNFKMLVSGNVDCAIPGSSAAIGKNPKADDFIELKTSAPLEDKYDPSCMSESFSSIKSWSWFGQCVLMGVKNVVVGIRHQDYGCQKLTVKRTHAFTLEELQRNSNGFWSKDKCFDVLKKFLCVVKEKVTVDDPDVINVFQLKDGWIRGPEKKTYADDRVRFPDISKVVELMNKL